MKKKLSLLIVAFMALAAYAGLNAWRAASDEVVYTFAIAKNSSNSDYTKTYDVTINGLKWNVPGNHYANNELRLGGKNLDKADRVITGKSAIDKAVGKITINHNGVTNTNVKINSVSVTVASDEAFTNVIETVSKSGFSIAKDTDGSIDIEPTSGQWAANSFYKITFNISNSTGTNYSYKVKNIVFYGVASGGEGETEETKTVYLKPGVWNADGARFAAYLFKDEDVNTWVDFTSTPGGDGSTGTYFKADIPVSYTSMILVRMKSGTTENNWDNKWNQTDDIDITELADKTLYRITGWGSGEKSPYDTTTWPEQSTDPDPQPEQVTWTVAGSNEALFGTAWAPALEANDMTLEDGVYKWEKENVTLLAGDVEFKVVKNHSWDESYPESNYVQSIEVGGIYTFTITFNAETKDIRVMAVKTGGISTIGELNALADKTAFTFFGDAVVVAKPADKYVYIADERGGSLIYDKNSVGTGAAEIGKTIATPWSGTVSIYNGLFEAIPTAALAVKDGDPVQVNYQEVDATYLTASNVNKVVKMNGLTITAINSKNITFKQGDAEVAGYNQFGLQLSADQVGKTYDVVGAIGRYNDKIQFQPISMEEVATPVTINSMYIVGELTGGWPDTEAGDWSMAKQMTKSADNANVWTLTVADFEAEAKEYKYKATANGKYGDYELPKEGDQKYTFNEAGKYNLLFTANTENHELTLEAKKVEEPTTDTWTVAGSPKSIFGQTWAISSEANNLSKGEGNVWSKTYTDKVVPKGNVYYAVFKNHGAEEYYPATLNKDDLEGTAEKLAIEATGKYEVTFTFNSETHALSAAANKTGDYTINSYVVNGNSGELFSGDLRLVQSGDGIWTGAIAGKQLSAGTINFSAKANGEDFISYDGSLTIAEAGKYDVTFTLNEAEGKLVAEAKPTPVETPETFAIVGELTGGWPEEGTVDAAVMTKQDNGLYVCEVEKFTAEAKTYKYKLRANNKYGVFDLPKDGDQEWTVKEAGDYKLIFTANVTGEEIEGVAAYTLILNEEKIQQPEPTLTGISIKGGTGSEWTEPFELILTAPTEEGGTEYFISDKQIKANTEFKVVAKYDNDSEKYLSPASEGKFLVDANQLDKALSLAENNPNMYFKQSGKFSFAVKNDLSTLTISGIFDEEPPTPEAHTYTIAGDAPIANGRSWAVDAEENLMTRDAEDSNKYTLHIEGAKLEAGTYGYKVVVDKSWNNQSIPKGDDAKLAISVDGIYDIDYTLTLGEADGELGTVEAVATKTGDVTFTKQYIVAGSENLTGYNWDASGEHNLMTDNGDGTWSLKYENKEMAASDAENPYKYKVVILTYADGEKISDNWRPNDDQVIEIREAGKYNVTISYKPETDEVSHNVAKAEEPVTEDTWTVAGDNTTLFGEAWKPELTANDMVKQEDGTYKWEKTEQTLTAGSVKFKVAKNHAWDEAYPSSDYVLNISENGKYTVTITFDPEKKEVGATATKTGEAPEKEVIVDEETSLNTNETLEVETPFTTGEVEVEDGEIITIDAHEADTPARHGAFRALAADDIAIKYKPTAESDWTPAEVTIETTETGYQFEVNGDLATAINARGFAIEAKKPIVVTEIAVVTTEPEPEPEPVYYAVGVKALWGSEWAVDEANKLTLNGEGKYTITKTGLTLDANTNYGYKVVKVVGETQTWIPDGMGNEKNLTVSERAVYSVTLTLDPAEPISVDSYLAVASKTGEAEPAEDATISKVEIRGSFNDWADGIELAKEGETNTYVGVLDLTELTADQNIKLVVNSDKWLNYDQMTVNAPEGWVTMSADEYKNIYLKNSTTGYKTYTMTATWTPSPDAAAGWTLTIAGKDERPAGPATISKVEIRGSFNDWADGIELAKEGETNTYVGVLDLTELTADQNIKLVVNSELYLDYDQMTVEAPDGWVTMSADEYKNIYLKNSTTGYKTYDITATWTPSSDAAAGWTLTIAGKDVRPAAEDTYTVYGAFYDGEGEHASILTKTWDPTATENDMVKGEGNVYTKIYADAELTVGKFQLKVAKNHSDAINYPEGFNCELKIEAAGKYDVVVTFNADTKDVSAVATPKDVPEANYYIVGSMTDWTVKAEDAYKLTLNASAETGIVEYMKTLDLAADAEFKIVKVQGTSETWYPDGIGNNYKITKSSNYTVYFRPNGDGGADWHYGYIYVVDNAVGINAVKAAIQKGVEVYTINGQRVQNPTKGLYIVNGRKVVVK